MTKKIFFEDLVEVKIDNRGKTPPLADNGYPLLEVNSISRNRLYPDLSKVSKFVTKETYDSWFRQHLEKNDILFTTVGTIAESAIIPCYSNAAVAQNILGFRFKSRLIEPFFALYLMRSKWFIDQIEGRTIETVQKSIKWSDIKKIKLELPSIEAQKKVSGILKAIDEKIELNHKMNETLEQMGQALFKKYFITNPEAENVPIINIIDFVRGVEPGSRNYLETQSNDSIPFLRVGDLSQRAGNLYIAKELAKGKIANSCDVLVSFDGAPGLVSVGLTGAYSSGIRKMIQKSQSISNGYMYFLMKSKAIQEIIERYSEGTTIKHASRAINYMNAPILEIEPQELNDLLNIIIKNIQEIQTLTTLRNSLLPRLISGRIQV